MDKSPQTMTITVNSEAEKIAVQSALAMTREVQAAAESAAPGTILHQCELAALEGGRELTRNTLEQVLQQNADEAQKKGRRPETVRTASNTEIIKEKA